MKPGWGEPLATHVVGGQGKGRRRKEIKESGLEACRGEIRKSVEYEIKRAADRADFFCIFKTYLRADSYETGVRSASLSGP